MSDIDLINAAEIVVVGPYAVSKGALNVVVPKYNALYKNVKDEEDKARLAALGQKFARFAPNFNGQMTPEESAKAVLGLSHKA
ncbi:hypothetical protein BDW68DRAFT_181316 [Aspergillus falconensis]